MIEPIEIKIKKERCDYCGNVKDTTMRSFSDNGSPISEPVCYSCQVGMGIESSQRCPECNRALYFSKKEQFWGCLEHGRKEVKEFPDSKHCHYVKEK